MNVQIFPLIDTDAVNQFVLDNNVEDTNINVTSEGVVVYYEDETTFKKAYLSKLIRNLEREVFFEETRLLSAQIELAKALREIEIDDVVDGVTVTKTGKHKTPKVTPEQSLIEKKRQNVELCLTHIELFKEKVDAYKSELEKLN
jgi:hypothetical protein